MNALNIYFLVNFANVALLMSTILVIDVKWENEMKLIANCAGFLRIIKINAYFRSGQVK